MTQNNDGGFISGSFFTHDLKFALHDPNEYKLRFKKLDNRAILPTKSYANDLGFDLYCLEDAVLDPGGVTMVRTGIACGFPKGYGALLRDRSSVVTKQEIFVVAGVIDQTYTGEIIVAFYNPGTYDLKKYADGSMELKRDSPEFFKTGSRIAQMILTPIMHCETIEVNSLEATDRGSNGFGSSGN